MTKTIQTKATVDSEGVVHLDLAVGTDLAGQEVAVELRAGDLATEAVAVPARPENDEAYLAALDRLHGSIDDPTFEYPTPGIYDPPPRW